MRPKKQIVNPAAASSSSTDARPANIASLTSSPTASMPHGSTIALAAPATHSRRSRSTMTNGSTSPRWSKPARIEIWAILCRLYLCDRSHSDRASHRLPQGSASSLFGNYTPRRGAIYRALIHGRNPKGLCKLRPYTHQICIPRRGAIHCALIPGAPHA